ncbi:MAG: hypothetical protein LBH00_00475 [Planctomycetaceae bacterium]|nr:hypothetical protein [Planctomycetaceae bacterium]
MLRQVSSSGANGVLRGSSALREESPLQKAQTLHTEHRGFPFASAYLHISLTRLHSENNQSAFRRLNNCYEL